MHILKINLRRLDLVVINQDYLSFNNYSENIVFIIQKIELSTTVAIITGGASGLGEATARYLHSLNSKIAI